jgi:23S rRNA (cytidine1920-2'-O)/16S rRNA (cytidine1409-2'-O)-methyltransferase
VPNEDTQKPDTKQRLDQELVARALAPSRARARDLILRGLVTVTGHVSVKPGLTVGPSALISVAPGAAQFVSRGGDKLNAALDAFSFDPAGCTALDVGASTGGFTDVLLQRGASRIYAVDVGHGQLHPSLAADTRVVSFEGTDARRIDEQLIPEPVDVIVADVSFISLMKALPAALLRAHDGTWLVALIKPQFEAGPGAISKGGLVRYAADRERSVKMVTDWLVADGTWSVVGVIPSPIAGGDGNQEFLLGARKRFA